MAYTRFDRSRLQLLPLGERVHDLDLDIMMVPGAPISWHHPRIDILAQRIRRAKEAGAAVIMMMGGHVIRSGAAPLLLHLMREGYITHLALNGAAAIHDFELGMIGATCESVARYVSEGQFGLWQEDARFNDAVYEGVSDGLGMGEALGRYMLAHNFPQAAHSLLAGAYEHRTPLSVHVGIGNDIVHELPNADGALTGEGSYRDFLVFTHAVENLEHGVFLNVGSAVTGPEVYLKALSMARNVKHQEGNSIKSFTTAVFDLLPLENEDIHDAPPKSDPRYYFRPWKTILARTVADGGESFYIQGEHRHTIAALHERLMEGSNANR